MQQTKPALLWRLLLAAASLLLLVGLLFGCLRSLITSRVFFFEEYTRLDNAKEMGMSTEDLTDATMHMVAYMEGVIDSIDLEVTAYGERVSMFNDRERAHMVDVRTLYQNWRLAAQAFLGLYILCAIFILWKRKPVRVLTHGFFHGSIALCAIALVIGGWVLLDFNSFWNAFHHLFFSNDLWLLDPATSRMINMMPLPLFYSIVLRMAGRFGLIWAGALLFCGVVEWYFKRKRGRVDEDGRIVTDPQRDG